MENMEASGTNLNTETKARAEKKLINILYIYKLTLHVGVTKKMEYTEVV